MVGILFDEMESSNFLLKKDLNTFDIATMCIKYI